ncbi:ABC transporter permease [Vineibacter terrae]|uniref:ABC transporter permease n=1 Tax=Vineibacter terrae TaxID=2586908 RepID=UPI002E37B8A2|nr:ABC transporter permease [Vineibacter terrae]HEX2888471.1 ABC transporter permease [Vineibacter terrae]
MTDAATALPLPAQRRGPLAATWRRLRRNPVTLGALAVIVVLAVVAVLAPVVAPFDPEATDPAIALSAPTWQNLLGTDVYGRDQLSRLIHAARLDLIIPFAATAAALVIGSLIGALSGYRGGWVDQVIMRMVEAVLAFPAFVLAMGLTAALGNSIGNIILTLAITQVPIYIRLIRGEMLRVREMEYAEAARTVGNPSWRIVVVHLLPNCIPPLIVQATLAMGFALLTMAALSFLGLGIRPPDAEWGEMTAEGASHMVTGEWWLFVFPGLVIMATVLAFNLVGDGLRDLLDPRMRGVR